MPYEQICAENPLQTTVSHKLSQSTLQGSIKSLLKNTREVKNLQMLQQMSKQTRRRWSASAPRLGQRGRSRRRLNTSSSRYGKHVKCQLLRAKLGRRFHTYIIHPYNPNRWRRGQRWVSVCGWKNNFDLSCPGPQSEAVALTGGFGIDANWRHLGDYTGNAKGQHPFRSLLGLSKCLKGGFNSIWVAKRNLSELGFELASVLPPAINFPKLHVTGREEVQFLFQGTPNWIKR